MRVLGALVALLFAGGVVGVATVTGDDEAADQVDTAAPSTTATTAFPTTTSSSELPTTTVRAAPVTAAGGPEAGPGGAGSGSGGGSGLGTGGSATVQGSDQMADTGADDWLVPGAALLGLALGGRRLLRLANS
jgi:hypothetical protein